MMLAAAIFRFLVPGVLAAALSGCVATPVRPPEAVAVEAGSLTPSYSSFNTQVLTDAGAVEHSFVASLDPDVEALTRLESAYVQSIGGGEESLRVGDTISSAGMWGSSVRYGGVQFGSGSTLREDVIASSRLATTGLAVLPTVADALFASTGAPGSPLAQQHLSVDRSLRNGSSSWDLVAHDTLGRSVAIDAPMIAGTRLVRSGCTDFSVGVGKVRRDYAITSNEYGPLFANTTVACAAPLGFTVEGHGEYLADQVAAMGIGVARQVGPFGTASVAFASSRAEAIGSGWLARVGFEHSNSLFNIMLKSRLQSREFREIGTISLADPVMQRDLASVGLNVAKGASVSLAYATQTTWARERTNLIALQQSMSLWRGSLSMSVGHSLADNFGSSLFISYRRPFGALRPARSVIEEFDLSLLHAPLTP